MSLRRVLLCALAGTAVLSQGCGESSSDGSDAVAGSGAGRPAGASSGGSASGSGSSGGPGTTGGAGQASSGGASTAGGGGSAAEGGRAGSGGTDSGGSASGGTTVGGTTSGGTASGGGSAGSAGQGGGGAGGGNNDGPCAVPSYIKSDAAPVGWASQGSGTTGGGSTAPILVTTLAQLKTEVSGSSPKVLYIQGEFAPDKISIGSNKTLIGCSSGAKLQGHIGMGSSSSNVIVRNLKISGYGVGDCAKDPSFDASEGCSSGEDAVSVSGSAHHIWFDHCLVMDGTDGNLDITNDADFVTVSWTKFAYTPRTDNVGNDSTGAAGHRFSNLVGGTDTAPSGWPTTRPLNVTWHHNWWADGVVERQPRVRYGRNHLFNNYYNSSASNYCVRAGIEASILLEANTFEGVDSPHQFNNSSNQQTAFIAVGTGDRANSYISTTGDKATEGGGGPFTPPYSYQVEPASAVAAAVKAQAGPH